MSSLQKQAEKGVRWTSFNTVCATIIQFVQIAVLGRILSANAFGLLSMVMVISGFSQIFAEMGLSSAIIQRKNVTREELSSLYWLNIAAGFIVYLCIFLLTPAIATFYRTDEICELLPIISLSFIFAPFGIQFKALLEKDLKLDKTSQINIIASVIGVGASIILAVLGYAVWSLVFGVLITSFVSTCLLVLQGWKNKWLPDFYFKWSLITGYLHFGLHRVGAMSANYFNSQIDKLLIGALLGPVSLGYYTIACRLVLEPIQRINPILTTVAFPVFSKIQDDTVRLKKGFLKMVSFILFINAPILIGLSVIAPSLVPVLIGEKWVPAISLIQILAFYALIRSVGNACGSLIIAKGKADWTFYWNMALLFVVPPVVYLASKTGDVQYIAMALVALQVSLFFLNYAVFIRSLLGKCFSEYFMVIGRPIVLAGIMGAFVLLVSSLLANLFSLEYILFFQIVCGVISYAGLSILFQWRLVFEIIELFPVLKRSSFFNKLSFYLANRK